MQQPARNTSRWTVRLAAACGLLAAAVYAVPTRADQPEGTERGGGEPFGADARYLGRWTDGSVSTASTCGPWDRADALPRLAGRPLFDSTLPIRWLLDILAPLAPEPRAFVEFAGGDRLPGRVVGYCDGLSDRGRRLPPHLVVDPYVPLSLPGADARGAVVRVAVEAVRRIVWKPSTAPARPGTLLLADGRQWSFRSLRFSAVSVRVLREDGIREVPFPDLAEVCLAERDPWGTHLEQLAALCPLAASRWVQLETAAGLRATGSQARFQARAMGDRREPSNWYHLCQPAWSLDSFWICHADVRLRCYFLPHEVPLSRIPPTETHAGGGLGGSWQFRIDRNTQGGPLASGDAWFAWGFGVHAGSRLEFPLPPCACRFYTRLGLDRQAGRGGCARARVRPGSAAARPAYESDFLVGSDQVLEFGPVSLDPAGADTGMLVLEVDAAHQGRPPGADPFDVRDIFDWLEPLVTLDSAWLGEEIMRRAPGRIPAWAGWTVTTDETAGARLVNYRDESDSGRPTYRLLAAPDTAAMKLRADLSLRPEHDRLLVAVGCPPRTGRSELEIRVDGRSVGWFEVPQRRGREEPPPLAVSLAEFSGGRVAVELIQRSLEPTSAVDWRSIELAGGSGEPE